MASVPQQSWNMVSGLLLSVLGDETLVTRLLQQDWVGTWEGWQEVDIHQPGTCEDAARRLLQISKDHAPLLFGSDAERLEQLREDRRRRQTATIVCWIPYFRAWPGIACFPSRYCLVQVVVPEHARPVAGKRLALSLYVAAIAERERRKMPNVGYSVDRRVLTHLSVMQRQAETKGLICALCAQICLHGAGRASQIGTATVAVVFEEMPEAVFRENWCYKTYVDRYATCGPMANADCTRSWSWRRRVVGGRYDGREVVCCPEDEECDAKHSDTEWCLACRIPLCVKCRVRGSKRAIPAALSNDNLLGYPPAFLYSLKVRYIEAAAASPLFAACVSLYIENDYGHLLEEELHDAKNSVAVRGSITSLEMPWPAIMDQFLENVSRDPADYLPHSPEILARMVFLHLRVAHAKEVAEWLPCKRVRPAVVLLLLQHLVQVQHPLMSSSGRKRLLHRLRARVETLYPEEEQHLPHGATARANASSYSGACARARDRQRRLRIVGQECNSWRSWNCGGKWVGSETWNGSMCGWGGSYKRSASGRASARGTVFDPAPPSHGKRRITLPRVCKIKTAGSWPAVSGKSLPGLGSKPGPAMPGKIKGSMRLATLHSDPPSLFVPGDGWMREAEARQERASQSYLRVQEQVHALVDFLAQEHVRQPQGREGPREKEIPRATSGHKPNPQAVAKLAQRAELAENPMLSERLRRIFSPPSRGNSVDSPPREDFVSGCLRGEEHRTAQVVKIAPPYAGAEGATPRDRETQAAETRTGSHSSCRGIGRAGSKGSITPGPATAPATPAASPQAGGLVARAAPATAAQANAWVQRATSGHTTPTAPVLRQVTGGTPGAPLTMVTPQFGQVFVAKPANAPIVAVASTQPPMRCQRMSSSSPTAQPSRSKRVSAPAHLVQVAYDPRLPPKQVTPFAAQVPQPLPLPPGSTGPRAQYDL
eukprot:s1503_g2.t2